MFFEAFKDDKISLLQLNGLFAIGDEVGSGERPHVAPAAVLQAVGKLIGMNDVAGGYPFDDHVREREQELPSAVE